MPQIGIGDFRFAPEQFPQPPGFASMPAFANLSGPAQEPSQDHGPVFQDASLNPVPDLSALPNGVPLESKSVMLAEESKKITASLEKIQESADPTAMEGKTVLVLGLLKNTELNGKHATCLGFDTKKGRWKVTMEDGSFVRLLPENCRFV